MQSKLRSFLESVVYTILGLAYAIPLNWLMLTKVTWPDYWTQAAVTTIVFTIIGIGFKYVTRRAFNWWDIIKPTVHKNAGCSSGHTAAGTSRSGPGRA